MEALALRSTSIMPERQSVGSVSICRAMSASRDEGLLR